VLIKDAHPGYITFEQYEHNLQSLAANAAAHSDEERRAGPAREGPALLQGLVVCGRCGKRMTVNYHKRSSGEVLPNYHCRGIATGTPPCQTIWGAGVDQAVATLVLEQLTPLAIETALAVSTELQQRAEHADRIRARWECNAPSMPLMQPADATSPWTQPTGWSPISSKPTGTTSCASSPTPKTSTSARPRPAAASSATSSRPRSELSRQTYRHSGPTRQPRCANANV
jgi:hypothetical protein